MSEICCTACGGTASHDDPCRCCGHLGYHSGAFETCFSTSKVKQHTWLIEEVKTADPKYYWVCRKCGASGGPSFLPWEQLDIKAPKWKPFLAGTPLQPVSEDCDEAKKQIDEFVEKYPEWAEYADRARGTEVLKWLKETAQIANKEK